MRNIPSCARPEKFPGRSHSKRRGAISKRGRAFPRTVTSCNGKLSDDAFDYGIAIPTVIYPWLNCSTILNLRQEQNALCFHWDALSTLASCQAYGFCIPFIYKGVVADYCQPLDKPRLHATHARRIERPRLSVGQGDPVRRRPGVQRGHRPSPTRAYVPACRSSPPRQKEGCPSRAYLRVESPGRIRLAFALRVLCSCLAFAVRSLGCR